MLNGYAIRDEIGSFSVAYRWSDARFVVLDANLAECEGSYRSRGEAVSAAFDADNAARQVASNDRYAAESADLADAALARF